MLLGKGEILLTKEVVPFTKGLPSYGHLGEVFTNFKFARKNSR